MNIAHCMYCHNSGFFRDELSGGESYCDCAFGKNLSNIDFNTGYKRNFINDNKELVNLIDECKYKLKVFPPSKMKDEFNLLLNKFITHWSLDSDPHAFASLPGKKK